MNMKRFALIFLALSALFFAAADAQVYKGILIDNKGVPVEYATVGIVGKAIGTTSNADGRFELKISPEHSADSIRFSIIGYETITWGVSDFINRNNDTILMKEGLYFINEVVISATETIRIILGNKELYHPKKRIFFPDKGLVELHKGVEMGVILNPKNKKVMLENIGLFNRWKWNNECNCFETRNGYVTYKLNLYRVKSKNDFENILTQPIHIRLHTDNFSIMSGLWLNISEYNLVIDGKTLITLECINDPPQGLYFASTSKGADSYLKRTSQGKWEKLPHGLAVFVRAKIIK
jgi:hypothetical protein